LNAGVDPDALALLRTFQLLRTAAGTAALTAATGQNGADPLAAASALRASGLDPALAAASLTQADLRRRAAGKFGADAERMFFTRAGLEQATRRVVADRRARRLATALGGASGTPLVADLGCGIGADAFALARAGLRVDAIEADPLTAEVASANAQALGFGDRVVVHTGDAVTHPLDGVDAVFCDPARRTTGGRRVFNPAAYSPPWDFVTGLPARVRHTVLKLAPGLDHDLIPAGAEAEWVSVDSDVVEAAIWCGPLAAAPRRATLIRGDQVVELTGAGTAQAPVAPPPPVGRRYLYDPDGAVVRAHLVAEYAALIGGALADPTIAYIYTEAPVATPYGRGYEIVEALPIAVKRLRAALRAHRIGRLTIAKRGSALDVEWLRRELRLRGDEEATLILTRVAGAPAAWLCRPLG
jgi:SAM-dependent methyltransferase